MKMFTTLRKKTANKLYPQIFHLQKESEKYSGYLQEELTAVYLRCQDLDSRCANLREELRAQSAELARLTTAEARLAEALSLMEKSIGIEKLMKLVEDESFVLDLRSHPHGIFNAIRFMVPGKVQYKEDFEHLGMLALDVKTCTATATLAVQPHASMPDEVICHQLATEIAKEIMRERKEMKNAENARREG